MVDMNTFTKDISDKLISYLKNEIKNENIEYESDLVMFPTGFQAFTYHFKLKGVVGELSMPLVLRLYPPSYSPNEVKWQSTIQRVLFEEGFATPKVFFINMDESILGGAFYIMAFLPGKMLYTASPEIVPDILGRTHADLHKIDPAPLINTLKTCGFDETRYGLTSQFNWMRNNASDLPFIQECVDWLFKYRPAEPEHLSICHRDFHAANILVDEGKVTGILDWGGLLITDPVFDVANTIMLHTIPFKHLDDSTSIDWDQIEDRYLTAYRIQRPLDGQNLSYYRAFRCLTVLIRGIVGLSDHFRYPPIVKDLVAYIQKITGLRIAIPIDEKNSVNMSISKEDG